MELAAFRADLGCTTAGEEGEDGGETGAWAPDEVVAGALDGEDDAEADGSGVADDVGLGSALLDGLGSELESAAVAMGASEAALSTSPSMTSSRTR